MAALAASVAVAATVVGTATPRGAAGSFGATVPVWIAHVGRIEVDLGAAGASGLRSVPCASAPHSATSCFVASARR